MKTYERLNLLRFWQSICRFYLASFLPSCNTIRFGHKRNCQAMKCSRLKISTISMWFFPVLFLIAQFRSFFTDVLVCSCFCIPFFYIQQHRVISLPKIFLAITFPAIFVCFTIASWFLVFSKHPSKYS